jgi:hypothetical protein
MYGHHHHCALYHPVGFFCCERRPVLVEAVGSSAISYAQDATSIAAVALLGRLCVQKASMLHDL